MKRKLSYSFICFFCVFLFSGCVADGIKTAAPKSPEEISRSQNNEAQTNAHVKESATDESENSETTDGNPDNGIIEIVNKTDKDISRYKEGYKSNGKQLKLIDKSEITLNKKSGSANIELYVNAEVGLNGAINEDDGQEWSLIVRYENYIYPLLTDCFVQTGEVNYWSCYDYDNETPSLLVMIKQGSSIQLINYRYDKQKDAFCGQHVYQTEGNVGVLHSSSKSNIE